MMRHRDAWAEPVKAPTREQYVVELAAESEAEERRGGLHKRNLSPEEEANMSDEADKGRRIVGLADDDLPKDVLVVVSKLKNYVKARSGMSTSDGVVDVLSEHLRKLCAKAIQHAATAGRKTVMERDFLAVLKDD
jgi:histone H3/H4